MFESQRPWVLKKAHEVENLYKKERWWQFIKGKEHRWARSLKSSQCFAVNLFGPLADDAGLAKTVVSQLLRHRKRELREGDKVEVAFEHTPEEARKWLGEGKDNQQPSQIDVFVTVSRSNNPVGYFLVEVKLSEPEFGSCRGWTGRDKKTKEWSNPDRTRCESLGAIRSNVRANCWMAGDENGRHYWDFIEPSNAYFDLSVLQSDAPCPFRYGLYQLMRNQVLAAVLVQKTKAEWVDFGVCLHPENRAVRKLRVEVADKSDALEAFGKLLSKTQQIVEINPSEVVQLVAECDHTLGDWRQYMMTRYKL